MVDFVLLVKGESCNLKDAEALRRRSFTCVLDTGAGINIIIVDVLDPVLLGSIQQYDMTEIRTAFKTELKAPETLILFLEIGEACISVIFGEVEKIVVFVLLMKNFNELFIR